MSSHSLKSSRRSQLTLFWFQLSKKVNVPERKPRYTFKKVNIHYKLKKSETCYNDRKIQNSGGFRVIFYVMLEKQSSFNVDKKLAVMVACLRSLLRASNTCKDLDMAKCIDADIDSFLCEDR
jgi:hypothetical protein